MSLLNILEAATPANIRVAFKHLDAVSSVVNLERELTPKMRVALADFLAQVVDDAFKDGAIKQRSGKSKSQIKIGVSGTRLDTIRGVIRGPVSLYANEYGASISPKPPRSWLTIPLRAACRPDGTPKLRSARAWGNIQKTFVYEGSSGAKYIVYEGGDGKLVFLYRLVAHTDIKQKAMFRAAYNKRLPILLSTWGSLMIEAIANTDLYSVMTKPAARRVAGGYVSDIYKKFLRKATMPRAMTRRK